MADVGQSGMEAEVRRCLAPFGIELDSVLVVNRNEHTEIRTTTSHLGIQYHDLVRGALRDYEEWAKRIVRGHLIGHHEGTIQNG